MPSVPLWEHPKKNRYKEGRIVNGNNVMTQAYISFTWHYYQILRISDKRKNKENWAVFRFSNTWWRIMIIANDQMLCFCNKGKDMLLIRIIMAIKRQNRV